MPTPPPNRPIITRTRTTEDAQMRAWLILRRELAELHARLEFLKLLVRLGVRQTRQTRP